MAEKADYSFSNDDLEAGLEKVRKCAANYDRGHPSSPSMSGFQGANMQPFIFKDLIMRCFHVALSGRELGALVKYWDTSETQTIDSQAFLTHFYKICRQEQETRRKTYIHKIRSLRKATAEQEAELEKKKELEESQKVLFSAADEATFMAKLRKAAKLYAFDSAALQEPLQAFKGPALNPLAFRDIFSRVFSSIKLTFPEVGVLLSILDTAGVGSLDGPRFLNWFYKLGRCEAKIMLGEMDSNNVTLESLRAAAASQPVLPDGGSVSAKQIRTRSQSRAQSSEGRSRSQSSIMRSSSNAGTGAGEGTDSPLTTSETVANIISGLSGQPRPKSQGAENRIRAHSQSGSFQKKPPMERSASAPTHFPEGDNQSSGIDFSQYGAFLEAVELFTPEQAFQPRGTTPTAKKRSKKRSQTKTKMPEIETLPKRPAGAELHTIRNSSSSVRKTKIVQKNTTTTEDAAISNISTSGITSNYLSTEVWTNSQLLSTDIPAEEQIQTVLSVPQALSLLEPVEPETACESAPTMAGMMSPISRKGEGSAPPLSRHSSNPTATSSSADGPLPSRSHSIGRNKLLIVKRSGSEGNNNSFFFPSLLGRIESPPKPFVPNE